MGTSKQKYGINTEKFFFIICYGSGVMQQKNGYKHIKIGNKHTTKKFWMNFEIEFLKRGIPQQMRQSQSKLGLIY